MSIMAYRFGKGEKTCAVVGALRGDEVQQLYVCARLVAFLREVEKTDGIQPGKSVMVVSDRHRRVDERGPAPVGTGKSWISTGVSPAISPARPPSASTDALLERRQALSLRRAAHQLLSARFLRAACAHDGHRTAEPRSLGCEFGLPYVYVRTPRDYDQTTLNYNWQLCGTQAYSLYAGKTREIDEAAADQSLRAIVRFLNSRGIIRSETAPGHASAIITNADMTSVSATSAGLLRRVKFAGAHVRRGEQLAFIINPCDGSVREVLKAPVTGMLFFMQDGPFITEHSPVFQVLAGA